MKYTIEALKPQVVLILGLTVLFSNLFGLLRWATGGVKIGWFPIQFTSVAPNLMLFTTITTYRLKQHLYIGLWKKFYVEHIPMVKSTFPW
jgi:hypothetical protein